MLDCVQEKSSKLAFIAKLDTFIKVGAVFLFMYDGMYCTIREEGINVIVGWCYFYWKECKRRRWPVSSCVLGVGLYGFSSINGLR